MSTPPDTDIHEKLLERQRMALEIVVGCVHSLLPTTITGNELLSRGVQQDNDCCNDGAGSATASLRRTSTFTSRVVTENVPLQGHSKGGSIYSQSRDSTASSYSGISDDLQGLLIPGRNVVLRFESMSAAELKVSSLILVHPIPTDQHLSSWSTQAAPSYISSDSSRLHVALPATHWSLCLACHHSYSWPYTSPPG